MLTGPHLHAHANLWALHRLLPVLDMAALRARTGQGGDLGTVQAWRPGSGVLRGPARDMIGDAVARNAGVPDRVYADRHRAVRETVMWMAVKAAGIPATNSLPDTLVDLIAAVPGLTAAVALNVALWSADEVTKTRALLGTAVPTERELIAAVPCPLCGTPGALAWLLGPPAGLRPIVCTSGGCLCQGPGCLCGTTAPGGLPHIWSAHQALAAGVAA